MHLLSGLGPKTAARLREVGIESEADLRAVGAAAAYRRLKHLDPTGTSLNALWGLHSALTDIPWTEIDHATKQALKREAGLTPDRGDPDPSARLHGQGQ